MVGETVGFLCLCDSSYNHHPRRRRDVFELLEDRVNQELSAREYRRDLLMTLLDNLD